jgi:hypothetical protein
MANGATVAAPLAQPLLSRRARELMAGYLYLVPVIVVLGRTVLFPILKAMHMSVYNHVLIKPQEYRYVGLANYARLLHDEVFWLSLKNSFFWYMVGQYEIQCGASSPLASSSARYRWPSSSPISSVTSSRVCPPAR